MTVATRPNGRVSVHVRDAVHSDDEALRAIAASCPMEGDITLRVTREPDFFALNRLEGQEWRVGVAESDGRVVGCAMAAERRSASPYVTRSMVPSPTDETMKSLTAWREQTSAHIATTVGSYGSSP